MTHAQARRISRGLLFRLRNDDEIQAALITTFGRPLSRKDPALRRNETKDMLALFWRRQADRHERVAKIAYRMVDVHEHIGTYYRGDTKMTEKLGKRARPKTRDQSWARPGDVLAWIILQITGRKSAGCLRCAGRVATMNKWGWVRCWIRRDEIIGWLVEELELMGYAPSKHDLISLFTAAYQESKKKSSARKACLSLHKNKFDRPALIM